MTGREPWFSDDADVDERWDAVTRDERRLFMVFGSRAAPGETAPDYAARILKFDPKITLANGRRLVAIFRAAYNDLVQPTGSQERPS